MILMEVKMFEKTAKKEETYVFCRIVILYLMLAEAFFLRSWIKMSGTSAGTVMLIASVIEACILLSAVWMLKRGKRISSLFLLIEYVFMFGEVTLPMALIDTSTIGVMKILLAGTVVNAMLLIYAGVKFERLFEA